MEGERLEEGWREEKKHLACTYLSGERGRVWSTLCCEQHEPVDCDASCFTVNTPEQRRNETDDAGLELHMFQFPYQVPARVTAASTTARCNHTQAGQSKL